MAGRNDKFTTYAWFAAPLIILILLVCEKIFIG